MCLLPSGTEESVIGCCLTVRSLGGRVSTNFCGPQGGRLWFQAATRLPNLCPAIGKAYSVRSAGWLHWRRVPELAEVRLRLRCIKVYADEPANEGIPYFNGVGDPFEADAFLLACTNVLCLSTPRRRRGSHARHDSRCSEGPKKMEGEREALPRALPSHGT